MVPANNKLSNGSTPVCGRNSPKMIGDLGDRQKIEAGKLARSKLQDKWQDRRDRWGPDGQIMDGGTDGAGERMGPTDGQGTDGNGWGQPSY